MVGAYVLITAQPGKAGEVVSQITNISGVKSANAVTGPYDAVAYVEVESFNDIGNLVVSEIQKAEGVERTLTCVTVPL